MSLPSLPAVPGSRFAVVEYSSKTGDVWRHTDGRPNYLADPQREIDPTSFGCYVSALAGEHIPLTGLIVGPVEAVPAPLAFMRKVYKRLSGHWPTYSLNYLTRFDVLMMVHQLSDAHEMAAAVRRLKRLSPATFVVGVPTQPYGLLKDRLDQQPSELAIFVEYMNACDVFLTVVKETAAWYESLTTTPVVYLPQPYPAAFASQQFVPLEQKQKTILVAGVTDRPNIRLGQTVAAALQARLPEYDILVPLVPEFPYDFSGFGSARVTKLTFEQWREHLQTLAQTRLVINTDFTLTRGRVQTDCAAVGTPSLGANSDGQRDLFPELAATPATARDALVEQGLRLLTDADYYRAVSTTARERLRKYDYIESADRLRLLVRTHQQRS